MKLLLSLLLLLVSCYGYSQLSVQGVVVDAQTKEPLHFCNVAIITTGQGTLTNQDGAYKFTIISDKDTVLFSYLGFKDEKMPASFLFKNPNVLLERKSVALGEITVSAGNDFLYETIAQCRSKIKSLPKQASQVYFQLETEIDKQPVEMLECYYNGYATGGSIEKLLLKNGRIGLARSKDGGFFLSQNTSRAVCYLDLINGHEFLPATVFQFDSKKLKKLFNLNFIDETDSIMHIGFTPVRDTNKFFEGEIWLRKTTYEIEKIEMTCANASIHPFLPLFEDGIVKNITISITEGFSTNSGNTHLHYLDFGYELTYSNGQPKARLNNGSKIDYKVSTNGLLLFYDSKKLFQLPYYKYNDEATDYRKITSMPYNQAFWESNFSFELTERQKRSLNFFKENGALANYKNNQTGVKGNYNVFEDNTIRWSSETRIGFKANQLDLKLQKNIKNIQGKKLLPYEMYNLSMQIFLDVNTIDTVIIYFSQTMFDTFDSYFYLDIDAYTDCFLNIAFDLCEIERRKMERTLLSGVWSNAQVDSIYGHTSANLKNQTTQYFREVQVGKNRRALSDWNNYVLQYLNIDNKKKLGLTD
ncbi:MAG: carboxypeptidase-like regulatory domain-containing protein [Bacteroidetes bacterium]|nr:carboxypeptidase-like regulatory domain-containing protein [Bacteroidota bacterium]